MINNNSIIKRRSFPYLIVTLITVVMLFSCRSENEDDIIEIPGVRIEEIGAQNTKIVFPGQDLHIQARIYAQGRIASVKLQITLATTNYGWDLSKNFTGYLGLLEADFHEHVNIPDTVSPGIYTLLIVVTDQLGRKVHQKVDFEIKKDPSLPVINNILLKVMGPELLNLSGIIIAPGKIGSVEVEVQSSVWTKNYIYDDFDMVGKTIYQLDKDIGISGAPSGHYHINVKLYDNYGKIMFYQFHLDR